LPEPLYFLARIASRTISRLWEWKLVWEQPNGESYNEREGLPLTFIAFCELGSYITVTLSPY